MVYADKKFWDLYEDFVVDALPRHEKILQYTKFANNLLDLGCGHSAEAKRLFRPKKYVGLDIDPPIENFEFIKTNYRNNNLFSIINEHKPDTITSLFSIEITSSFVENYKLYNSIFKKENSVKQMIVAGFYYENRKGQMVVEEVGGIKSYQSIENPEIVKSNLFNEKRMHIKAPSNLFGDDVIEVWKVFTRK